MPVARRIKMSTIALSNKAAKLMKLCDLDIGAARQVNRDWTAAGRLN